MAESYKASYAPEIEHVKSIARSLDEFRLSHLSNTTSIAYLLWQQESTAHEATLNGDADVRAAAQEETKPQSYKLFFIHKYLHRKSSDTIPQDANKLRISGSCFESLVNHLVLPPSFVFSLTRHYLPNGQGSRKFLLAGNTVFDFWYFLPIRVQVESKSSNTSNSPSSSQMNPFHKLHLPDANVDIHRSCIGIFSRVDPVSRKFTLITFDFMNGLWPRVALEPKERLHELFRHQGTCEPSVGHEFRVHLVYLSSAARWWTNVLNSVDEQLIAYEQKLQVEFASQGGSPEELNKALHSVTAHLQRYISELQSLSAIITDLLQDYSSIHNNEISLGNLDAEEATRGYRMVYSGIEATYRFAVELEKKAQNTLALLFNRIQISNDRMLFANGQAMQAILRAMQEDTNISRQMAKESHVLAKEMKKDSVAMKTIAIVTMFFLPGATFAALLSMPFFDDDEWFSHASQFWVWIVLTIPFTVACFAFYKVWQGRARKVPKSGRSSVEPLEDFQ